MNTIHKPISTEYFVEKELISELSILSFLNNEQSVVTLLNNEQLFEMVLADQKLIEKIFQMTFTYIPLNSGLIGSYEEALPSAPAPSQYKIGPLDNPLDVIRSKFVQIVTIFDETPIIKDQLNHALMLLSDIEDIANQMAGYNQYRINKQLLNVIYRLKFETYKFKSYIASRLSSYEKLSNRTHITCRNYLSRIDNLITQINSML